MEVYVFTIRSKADNSLIYAEGSQHDEYHSHFSLAKKWLTEADLTQRNKAWQKTGDGYRFNEEIRHLFDYEYDLVSFALEDIEVK